MGKIVISAVELLEEISAHVHGIVGKEWEEFKPELYVIYWYVQVFLTWRDYQKLLALNENGKESNQSNLSIDQNSSKNGREGKTKEEIEGIEREKIEGKKEKEVERMKIKNKSEAEEMQDETEREREQRDIDR